MKIYFLTISTFSDNQINLLKHLSKDIDVTYGVVIPYTKANYSGAELESHCNGNNIKLEKYALKYRFRDLRLFHVYNKIIKSIKAANPDIIYFTNFDQVYLNLLLLRVDKKKTIIAFHDVEVHSKYDFGFLRTLARKMLISAFRIFQTYSEAQRKRLKELYPAKSVYTIPLPLINFGTLPARPVSASKKTSFLFFGNILYYKGVDILLKSISSLSKKNKDFVLTIAGRCDDWDTTYEPLIENYDVIRKEIRFIENEEIPSLFAAADYVILPYRDTTQSGPLMIAYNYNIPVIASKVPGFEEFVEENTTGFFFDHNANSGNSLEEVLDNATKKSKEEYQNLRDRMRIHVKNKYSNEVVGSEYKRMFETVSTKTISIKKQDFPKIKTEKNITHLHQ